MSFLKAIGQGGTSDLLDMDWRLQPCLQMTAEPQENGKKTCLSCELVFINYCCSFSTFLVHLINADIVIIMPIFCVVEIIFMILKPPSTPSNCPLFFIFWLNLENVNVQVIFFYSDVSFH